MGRGLSFWHWTWFAAGLTLFAYGLITDGGPAGWLLSWQLKTFHVVDPGITHFVVLLVLVVPPSVALLPVGDRSRPRLTSAQIESAMKRTGRRMILAGAALLLAAGAAFLYTLRLPNPASTPAVIRLDELPSTSRVSECNAVLVGVAQKRYQVRYGFVTQSGRWSSTKSGHRIIPMTPRTWTLAQPVHFLIDNAGVYPDEPAPVAGAPPLARTSAGLLLRNVPPYMRVAFARQGLTLAGDVMLHSTNPDAAVMDYDVFAALSAFLGFMLVAFGILYIVKPGFDKRRGVWPYD